jgi:predicted transcriptional regulator
MVIVDDAACALDNQARFWSLSMNAITIRISDDTAERLDQLARKLDRSQATMAEQAIEDFIVREEWQIAEIEAGLAEADAGDFATAEEVAAVAAKYVKPGL